MIWKLILFFTTIAAILAVAGCDRYIDSENPVRPEPQPGPVPTNLKAELLESAVALYWDISQATGISKYRVYSAPSGDTSRFTLRDSTTTTSIVLDNLPVNQRYYFAVAAVSTSGLEYDRCDPVAARVLHLSISLNGGADYTSDRDIQVRVNLPTGLVSYVQLSEEPALPDAAYQLVSGTAAAFTLSDGDGVKKVYAKFQFDDGTEMAQTVMDSIVLDTYLKVDSVFFSEPDGAYFTTGEKILFGLDAGEPGGSGTVSFTGSSGLVLFDNGTNGDPVADDGVYHYEWTVPLNYSVNNGIVTGSFTDRAGNRISQTAATRPLVIYSTPLPVTVSAEAISGTEIELTWTQSVSSNFASYRIYRESDANVDQTSTLVTTLNGQTTTTYTDTGRAPGTTYYYRVYVRDQSGLTSGSNVDSATTPEP